MEGPGVDALVPPAEPAVLATSQLGKSLPRMRDGQRSPRVDSPGVYPTGRAARNRARITHTGAESYLRNQSSTSMPSVATASLLSVVLTSKTLVSLSSRVVNASAVQGVRAASSYPNGRWDFGAAGRKFRPAGGLETTPPRNAHYRALFVTLALLN